MLMIDAGYVLDRVRGYPGIKNITVQAPEGLRKKALELSTFLETAGYTVVISASPCYGACDLEEYGDLLVHVGHTRIYSTKRPVVFVEVTDDFNFVPTLEKNVERIPARVGLLTTAQHRLQLESVGSFLRDNQVQVHTATGSRTEFEGQILGCDLTAATKISHEVDAFLYLGTGTFHPLGAAIATRKPVFRVYDTFEPVNSEKMLRKRHALIFEASRASTFGVVISTKKGQYRMSDALAARAYLKEKGKNTFLFVCNEIRPEYLYGCDAYVICACPRIALDDAALFEPPVLTCKEVPLMFEEGEYTMDMIV
ncbi:MAG: diphthamide biosynthesis enzyme Dph2 [Theionarchaea archaeon]|nr:diphthamide biosynthesis enzyme Dph2 [Theionarchaea archaeon]MBU7035602.1 diphthamide biosynthesis enzyme Dph2 [Theionarchaea archaeon]